MRKGQRLCGSQAHLLLEIHKVRKSHRISVNCHGLAIDADNAGYQVLPNSADASLYTF
jgi:hypothetical protein